jgi:1-acyl-sn-glycerol-3-phosphate acyltransferase
MASLGAELVRGVLFWTGAVAITLIVGPPALFAIAFDPEDRAIHRFQQLWARLILAWLRVLGVQVVFEGLEHLLSNRSSILVANHASLVDIFALSAIQPPHTRWVAKAEIRNLPIVGWGIRLAGFVFVDRQGRAESVQRSFQATERILSEPGRVMNLLFFPEGTRTRDGSLLPFKRGAFRTAVQWKLPIVPIAIDGAFPILPRGWLGRLRNGSIHVNVMPPIRPAEPSEWSEEKLMSQTRARITEALKAEARELPAGTRLSLPVSGTHL